MKFPGAAPIADQRPDPATQQEQASYVRSFLAMRVFVGVLGLLLPLLLVLIDRGGYDEHPFPRDSLSAYYYSGMRDVFIAILSATGVFLITYKIAEWNLDNATSILAGIAAVLIPQFPTGRPSHPPVPLTPLQDSIGETAAKTVHFTASAIFLVALAALSFFFGLREGERPRRRGTRLPPEFWRWFHWTCTAVMALALLWIVATMIAGSPSDALLIGEWVSAWAFGISWLAKGAEFDMLFGTPKPLVAQQP
jgi:hypothetical protein